MVRSVRGLLLAGALAGSLTFAARGFAPDPPPCTIPPKGDPPVAKACAKGGVPEAKKVMKDLGRKAKAAGTKLECDACHKNDTKYDLTDDARDKFKKLLAAAG